MLFPFNVLLRSILEDGEWEPISPSMPEEGIRKADHNRVAPGTGIDGAFGLTLVASCVTSALWWQVKEVLESWALFMAFSIVPYLLVISSADARIYLVPIDRVSRR